MPSLKELLSDDMGSTSIKTAAAASGSDIETLAAQLGIDFGEKTAGDESGPGKNGRGAMHENSTTDDRKHERSAERENEEAGEGGEHKTASFVGMEGLFNQCFPQDTLGAVKTASQSLMTKEAMREHRIGERAREYHEMRRDQRLDKLASDILMQKVAYGPLAKGPVANHNSENPNHMENDHAERNNGGKAMDLTPEFDNEMVPEHSDTIVGHEEWANGHNTIDNPKGVHHMKKAALALRKAQISALLED